MNRRRRPVPTAAPSAAALRADLTGRLGLVWGPVTEGHADIDGLPAPLVSEFSKRSEQMEARLAELIADWTDAHDGDEPDPCTLYRLERMAVLDSRPGKEPVGDTEVLRASWCQRAAAISRGELALPVVQAQPPGTASLDREAIVASAIEQMAASSSTWLAANLAREIATLVLPVPRPLEPSWWIWSTR